MRNISICSFLIAFSLLLFSCDGKRKEKAEQVVSQFHQAYKSEDIQEFLKLYPNVIELEDGFYKTDELEIKGSCILPSKDILVIAEDRWTNGFGKTNTRTVKFFVREFDEDGEKQFKIFDTKNFVVLSGTKLYKVGLKGGAFNLSEDTTDILISRKIQKFKPLYNGMVRSIREDINKGLTYTGLNWHTGYYSNYASGSCSITNDSPYPIKSPDYKVTYYKSDSKTVVATDDGTICYGWWYPGETKRVSWYTSDVPYTARRAGIDVVLDYKDDWIEEIIEAQQFSGYEFK